jgi:hypothetical protein
MSVDDESAYQVNRASLESDREDIIRFWQKHFKGWLPGKFDQFYLNNPRGKAPCWIVREGSHNEVVAAYALFPRHLWIDGELCTAGICGDMGADISHRGHGLGRKLQQAAREFFDSSNWSFLYGTANILSEKVLSHEDFISIGRSVRLARVLRSGEVLKRKRLGKLIAPVIGPVSDWLIKRWSTEQAYSADTEYELKAITSFDERFDALFESSRNSFPIIGERSSQILNWRFADSPQKDFQACALQSRKTGDILGYAVYQIREKVAFIEDLYASDPGEGLRRVLGHFILALLKKDIATINLSFFGAQRHIDLFAEFGFSVRTEERTFVMLIDKAAKHYDYITNQENWYFFHADNDVDA